MHFIGLPDGPGIEGVVAVVRKIKSLADPDPWAETPNPPITIHCHGSSISLARLLRLDSIPGVRLQAV